MQDFPNFYIGGRWVAPAGSKTIPVLSASTEQPIGSVPEGNATDADNAVAAARGAFEAWSQTAPAERATYLQKIHAGLKARTDELARTITSELGMPLKMSQRVQVGSPVAIFQMYAKMLETFEFEKRVGNSLVTRDAVGVVACITPWNYPLHQIAAKVAAALAAGCTVILKPSEVAPLNAFILAEIVDASGLPPGVFNLVSGYGVEVGEALVAHPDVDMVSFTGSTAAGKRITAVAAQTVKRVALELGGKSAAIVLDDADFATAIKAVVSGCLFNSGQTCSALTRLLVPEARYAEVAQLAVEAAKPHTLGDPFNEATRMGPLASQAQRERVRSYIARGIADGAELLCGGVDAPQGLEVGYYVKPTVFGRVAPQSAIAQEEIFGPVLSIITYRDEDEAVRIANDSLYGLSGAVHSASDEHALKIARRLRTGQVDINGGQFNMFAPFGGYKQSGNGRELGAYGLEEFLEFKSLQLKPAPRPTEVGATATAKP
jgi:aldehyde dehydrogenase (NAD+)